MFESTAAVHPSAYVFAALTLGGALFAVSLHNVLHAIFAFAVSLLGVAVLFVYLGSPLLGALEILIYAGGIGVAMVFAVMFAYAIARSRQRLSRRRAAIGAAVVALLAGGIGLALWRTPFAVTIGSTGAAVGDWSVAAIGRGLLTRYNLVFEVLSVVLLLAIVGAIIIARRTESR